MKKQNLIIVAVLIIGILIAILFYFSKTSKESQFYPEPNKSEPAETGEDTYCNSNEDCWCRSFTGAKFIPGEKVPHRCNMETNRCLPCYYE